MQVNATGTRLARPRSEQRVHPRALFSVPLKLHHLRPGGVSTSRGLTLDLSQGGVGALVQIDLIVSEAIEIELQLPNGSLSAVAIVRYSSSIRSGFEFVGLSAEERQQIAAAIGGKPNAK